MERRQNAGEKRKIVNDYLKRIEDDKERLVCFLLMKKYRDLEICGRLKIVQGKLDDIKISIRRGLRRAGIKMGGGA